jgi:hypothetical protein
MEKSGQIVSSYPSLAMLLHGDAECHTTLSAEFFVARDPEVCNLYGYKNMI